MREVKWSQKEDFLALLLLLYQIHCAGGIGGAGGRGL